MKPVTPAQIDAILPQTQCGLCGYGGCMPYAEAMAKQQAQINLCPPGGVHTLQRLGELLQQDPTPFLAEMQQKAKPTMVAIIREAECIGCTKCIQACPVDAIMGSAKQMHSIITDECTGCELCLIPCPVDCIEMQPLPPRSEQAKQEKSQLARQRFSARQQRLQTEKIADKHTKELPQPVPPNKQAYIQAALERARSKKQNIIPQNHKTVK